MKKLPVLFCWAVSLSLLSFSAIADNYGEITQLYKKGQKDKALELINAYLGKLPKDAWGRNITQARFLKGVILAEQKRPQEAIRVFTELTRDYPDLPEPYNNLAALYASQGRYEEARDTLERSINTNPSYAAAHANLSDIYAQLSSQAYDSTLHASKTSRDGKPTQALITELCDNYGRMASQVTGRKTTIHSADDLVILKGINLAQNSAGKPPVKVNIDEMAMAPEDTIEPPEKLGKMPQEKTATPAAASKQEKGGAPEAAKEASSKQDQDNGKDDSDEAQKTAALQAVQAWANAWSRKNTGGYLAAYSRDFKTPDGTPRREWEATRKERITKPKAIKVTVEAPQVSMVDKTHARISFRQGYQSDTLRTSTHKTLLLVKSGNRWLIQEEKVAK